MAPLSLEHLSVFGLPPVEFVTLAADLDCEHICTGLTAYPYNPHGYAPFSLRDDTALRRETIAAMRDRGVSIALGDGFTMLPSNSAQDFAGDLDIMLELGVRRINMISMDPDVARTQDEIAKLAELAGERGMESTIEFCPLLTIADIPMALALIQHVGRSDFRMLVDTLHVARSGATPADLAALDPAQIGYIQLCDAPLEPVIPYSDEAAVERMAPGQGGLPLREMLEALPSGLIVGLEIPQRSLAEAGVGPHERLRPCVEGARRLLG